MRPDALVAVDAVGVIPIFIGFTLEMTGKRIRKVILQSMATAEALAVAFIFLGIEIYDFMITGPAVLRLTLPLSRGTISRPHTFRTTQSQGGLQWRSQG